jgi:hypothetical protein
VGKGTSKRCVEWSEVVGKLPTWLLSVVRWLALRGVLPAPWRDEVAIEYFRRAAWKFG